MLLEWPEKIPGRIFLHDKDYSRQRHPPTGMVIHSGERGEGLAEASLKMDISYHFAWSSTHKCFVQLVSCQNRAWHAGSQGNHWLGIALTGPWHQRERSDAELKDFRLLVKQIQEAFNWTIKYWCRHSDIDIHKRDPGPGFNGKWLDGLGVEWRRADD